MADVLHKVKGAGFKKLQSLTYDSFTRHYGKLYLLVSQSYPTLGHSMDCTVCEAPLSMEFPKQEYWSGLLFVSPGSSWPRDQTRVSGIAGRFFSMSATVDDSFTWNYGKTTGKIIHISGFQPLVIGGGVNDEGSWIFRVMKLSYILLIIGGTWLCTFIKFKLYT